MTKSNAANVEPEAGPLEPPKVVLAVGRGKCGKTVFNRWAADRAINQGRDPIIADADRTNRTLAAFFPNLVVSPPGSLDDEIRPWFGEQLEQVIERRQSMFVDFGGGDQLLKHIASDMDMPGFLAGSGVDLVLLHFIAADLDDLTYLQETEHDALLAPERTAVVFNIGAIPTGVSAQAAWTKHKASPIAVAAVKRGVRFVHMPRLMCMTKLDDMRARFTEADSSRLGAWDAQYVTMWLHKMEEAFAPIQEWLP